MTSRNKKGGPDEPDRDPGLGPDSGGQSGDTQGLSLIADEADESVEELADSGQGYEAEVVTGVEDADEHPERPVHTREDERPPSGGTRAAKPE
jgi:hypothetical protein